MKSTVGMILAGMAATVVVLKRIQRVLHQALTACTVVAVGSTSRGPVVCPAGSALRQAAWATSSACALLFSSF